MNLYLVTRTDEADWEEDTSAVVAAESPTLARKLMRDRTQAEFPRRDYGDSWLNANAVLIGTAKRETSGVLHVANRGA